MKASVYAGRRCADIAEQLSGVGQTPGSPRQRNQHRSGAGAGPAFGGDPALLTGGTSVVFRAIRIARTNTRAATTSIRLSASWKAAEPSTRREGNSSPLFARSSRKTVRTSTDIRSGRCRARAGPLKGIDEFRADARYGGDGTRVDLAYAVYALSHGAAETDIIAALHSRDLSHKGSQKRQDDYVHRRSRRRRPSSEAKAFVVSAASGALRGRGSP